MEPKMARRERKEQALHDTPADLGGVCADTIILTLAGEMAAADLVPGTRLVTRDSGVAVLRAVEQLEIQCDMVSIKAGSLGHRRPPLDLVLPAETRILVRDWRAKALFGKDQALVPAHKLQDREFVRILPDCRAQVMRLIFDTPHILYAGGLELACQTPAQG